MSVRDRVRRRLDPMVRQWWPVLVVTLVSALAISVTVAAQADDKLTARVGQVVQAGRYDLDDVTDLATDRILLPTGGVQIAVGTPITDTSGEDFEYTDLEEREPPDDGSFVALSTESEPRSFSLPTTDARTSAGRIPVRVELVADGRSYPVPASADARDSIFSVAVDRTAWVAVAGRPKTLSVAITFDGVRQTVTPGALARPTGRAAVLYGMSNLGDQPSSSPCGSKPAIQRGFASENGVDCETIVYPALPYLPQFGWAPTGSRWQAIMVTPASIPVFTSPVSPDVEYYAFRDPVVRVTLDGATANAGSTEAPALLSRSSYHPSYLAVFRVPEDGAARRLVVTGTWPKTNSGSGSVGRAPVAPDVTVTWTRSV